MACFDFKKARSWIALFESVHLTMAVAAQKDEIFTFIPVLYAQFYSRPWSRIARCSNVAHLSYYANRIIIIFRYEKLDATVRHRAAPSSSPPQKFECLRIVIARASRQTRVL